MASIPLLLGLAAVLLALSPSAVEAGDPIAWGCNFYGQCTVPLTAQSGVIAIAGGEWHSLALLLPPPVAEFHGSPTSGAVPLTVSFTDLSTNSPTAWGWDSGDGGTSAEQDPSYTYLLAGVYTPSMTATNAGGSDTETKAGYIVVNFVDVGEDNWAYGEIITCADAGIATGYPDGSYQPGGPVNRAQMAVYVARALVAPAGEVALADYAPADPRNFPDVLDTGYGADGTEPHWAYRYVEYCLENGVVHGYDDGLYRPDQDVTRDQMSVYIARAFGLAM